MPAKVIAKINHFAASCKKYKGIIFTHKDDNKINDDKDPESDIFNNIEMPGVDTTENENGNTQESDITGVQTEDYITGVQTQDFEGFENHEQSNDNIPHKKMITQDHRHIQIQKMMRMVTHVMKMAICMMKMEIHSKMMKYQPKCNHLKNHT